MQIIITHRLSLSEGKHAYDIFDSKSDNCINFIKCISVVYIIRLILKHNLFIHHLKIKIKFLGLDIEVKSKEKSAPSNED